MLKRIFWLALIAVAGWLIWMLLRQRRNEFAAPTPQFAPPRPFNQPVTTAPAPTRPTPPTTATGAPHADPDKAPDAAPSVSAPAVDRVPLAAAAAITTANENERATAEASNVVVPEAAEPLEEEVVGYCVRCKTKRPIKDAHEETTESGRRAARGVCSVCGANMFTFLAMNDEES